MRKMLGILTIALAAFFLIAVSASAAPKSHHHPTGHHVTYGNDGGHQGGQCGDHQSNREGDNGGRCQCDRGDHFGQGQGHEGSDQGDCQGGDQGGQCGEQGDHQSNGEGDRGGRCQCDQGDHFGQGHGHQGGDRGDCRGGDGTPPGDGGDGGSTPPGDGGGEGGPTPPPVVIQPTIDLPSHTFLCYSVFEVDPAVYTFDWAWRLLTSPSDHYFTPYAVKGNVQLGTNVGGYHLVCNVGLLAHKAGTPGTYADSDGQVFDQTWADAMASDHGSYNGMTLNVFPVVG